MRKLPFFLAAALFSTSLCAQSSVSLYGRVDIGTHFINVQSTATRPSANLRTLTSDGSLLGFRGTEDLGGGRAAHFKLEHGFLVDSGANSSATQFWNRESWVGLSDRALGTLQLGSHDSPALQAATVMDTFNRFGMASNVALLQGGRGYSTKYNNAVQYLSPAWAGLRVKLVTAPSEDQATGRGNLGFLEYSSGPLRAALGYDQMKATRAAVGLPGAGPSVWNRTLALGAVYDFQVLKVHGWYQKNRVDGLSDVTGYLAGVTVPIGAASDVRLQYTRRNAANGDASLLGAGFYYVLSKRTLVYTQIARLKNSGAAAFALSPSRNEPGAVGLVGQGQDSKGMQFNVRHVW